LALEFGYIKRFLKDLRQHIVRKVVHQPLAASWTSRYDNTTAAQRYRHTTIYQRWKLNKYGMPEIGISE
jgi:hypothetical protein